MTGIGGAPAGRRRIKDALLPLGVAARGARGAFGEDIFRQGKPDGQK